MKIFILASGYPTGKYKKKSIFEFDQAKALANFGHEVIYISIDLRSIRRWRKWGLKEFNLEGIKVISLNFPVGKVHINILNKIGEVLLRIVYSKAINKYGKPDIVHSHFIDQGYKAVKVLKPYGVKIVHTEHSSNMNQEVLESNYEKMGELTYNKVDMLISVSEYLGLNIEKKFGKKPLIVPNIVDTEIFNISSNEKPKNIFNFISVGNLVLNKRMDLLITSFYQAFKNEPSTRLIIFGEGPERPKLEELILKYKLADQIKLMGLVSREKIAEYMATAHCFVLVSRLETFGVAYIEAMAAGLPVIATKSGAQEEIVNEKNGVLVPVDNQKELVLALKNTKKKINKYNREQISKETKEKYSSVKISQRLTELYNHLE